MEGEQGRVESETESVVCWQQLRPSKTVREYRHKSTRISQILNEHPEVLDCVHHDLGKLSEGGRKGRESDFTSETRGREWKPRRTVRPSELSFIAPPTNPPYRPDRQSFR